MKKILISLLVSLLMINQSYAESGSSGYVDIKTLRVGGGFLRITGVTVFADPSSCNGASTNDDILVLEDTPSYKEIVSFVLSAKMTKKKVNFWLNGCATDSGNSYPKALFVYIQD